ncbi:putative F-box protein At4g22030 [Silene latifolia]|uniref:putative F-box protein At4g22030 n=1 Tax=Silene latifolia TaxID=37657 RepID=UPI003D76E9E0
MISLQACTNLSLSTNHLFSTRNLQISSINRPTTYLKKPMIVVPKLPNIDLTKNLVMQDINGVKTITSSPKNMTTDKQDDVKIKLYAILEAISDRIEMHNNVKEQRDNWNSLLLNSINMITLSAATMAGVSTMGEDNLALKVSSVVLFTAATGLLLIMNKIQPSQLAQEQRNSVRLFKQLKTRVETTLTVGNPTRLDVDGFMEQVLALDRAYPLPLLGAMLDKFPETYKPARWWPTRKPSSLNKMTSFGSNGWNKELEEEMRDIVEVIEKKDIEDYVRLGNKALKLNKMLAVVGPVLTGIAAVGSGFAGHGAVWGGVVAAVAGSMAGVVNTIEHGGQVGMVFEMYRNCGGFFNLLDETIETSLEERDFGKRENGELFEMKMALKLGRSLSELRDLADKSRRNGGFVDEFASKLF